MPEMNMDAVALVMDIADSLTKKLKKGIIVPNFRGHNRTGKSGRYDLLAEHQITQFSSSLWSSASESSTEEAKALVKAYKTGVPMKDWFKYRYNSWCCGDCGKWFGFETNGVQFRATTKCKYPDGLPPFEFTLNVPSGKMVVANDLRDLFPVAGSYDVNCIAGELQTTKAYEKIGLAHAFVGNSCPGVFNCHIPRTNANTRFVIGQAQYDEGDKYDPKDDGIMPVWEDGRGVSSRVGGVCTDLWWYSVCDYDEYTKRAGKTVEQIDPKLHSHDIVKCVPGVYHFRHVVHRINRDANEPLGYCFIERIGPPRKPKDYMKAWRELNLTAGQIMKGKLDKWPSLYARDLDGDELVPDKTVQRLADQLMCVIGTGDGYHPNGFWCNDNDLTNDSPSLEIPVLDARYRWYPLSDFSVLAVIAGIGNRVSRHEAVEKVNSSFVALSFNVSRCILTHGITGYSDDCGKHAAYTFRFAKKCMAALRKRYPDQIPENCRKITLTDKPYVQEELETLRQVSKKAHKRVVKILDKLTTPD